MRKGEDFATAEQPVQRMMIAYMGTHRKAIVALMMTALMMKLRWKVRKAIVEPVLMRR